MASNSNNQQPLITDVHLEQQSSLRRLFPAKQIFTLSVALIVFGACSMLFNGLGLVDEYSLLVASPGFYCGGFFVATGGIGIKTAIKKSRCFVIALMIMSISSAGAFAAAQFGVTLASLVKDAIRCSQPYWWRLCYGLPPHLAMAMDGLLVACAIVAASLSIRLSVLCCQLTCRCCVNGDCDCTCCDVVQDSAIPIGIYHQRSPHQPWLSPNVYVDYRCDAQRQTDDNIRQLSQLPPAQLQYLLAISQSTPWPWPPVTQAYPHQQPPSYAGGPVAHAASQCQGRGHQALIVDQ